MSKRGAWIALGAGALAIGGLLWIGGRNVTPLDRSVVGFEGLRLWLPKQGVETARSNPRLRPATGEFSLRILPVYDTDLEEDNGLPESLREVLDQSNLRNTSSSTFVEKRDMLASLVILPKWKGTFARYSIAHRSFLIPLNDLDRLAGEMGLEGLRLERPAPLMAEESLPAFPGLGPRKVALFHAQVFARESLPSFCVERAGLQAGALVLMCESEDLTAAHYVSDPDLFNNHGLALAENAAFAADLAGRLAGPADEGGRVYLDLEGEELLRDVEAADLENESGADYERGSAEWGRFFKYPLSAVWVSALLCMAAALWRGALRFGPPLRLGEGREAASKTAAVAAEARLMRLSGGDARLSSEYARARLNDLARRILGAGAAGEEASARLYESLARRDKAGAERLRAAAQALTAQDAALSAPELRRRLTEFKSAMDNLS